MLWGFFGFIVTIGLLVTIHEYGHFRVARFFGVKIVRFSLGFGKPVVSWTGKREGTRYTLAAIPLGGFVQMYGEDDSEEVPEDERAKTFSAKPAWQRFLIVFAGPAVNLLFAIFAFSLLFMVGVKGIAPTVVHVKPQSLAASAGIASGDVLVRIDGQPLRLAADAHVALVGAGREKIPIVYSRDERTFSTRLDLSGLRAGDEMHMGRATGVFLADEWWPAVVSRVIDGSAAQEMGIAAGDRIVAFAGEPIDEEDGSFVLAEKIAAKANQTVQLTIVRKGQELVRDGRLGSRNIDGKTYGFLGVAWQRTPDRAFFERYRSVVRYGPLAAVGQGIKKAGHYLHLTFDLFIRMLRQEVSFDNLGGPVTIGDAAGKTLRIGWSEFLNFLGILSLSLAAINLLPIPMLDGGHMLFHALEMVRGKPLSARAMTFAYRIGAFVVFSFMGLVLLNDFRRYLG